MKICTSSAVIYYQGKALGARGISFIETGFCHSPLYILRNTSMYTAEKVKGRLVPFFREPRKYFSFAAMRGSRARHTTKEIT